MFVLALPYLLAAGNAKYAILFSLQVPAATAKKSMLHWLCLQVQIYLSIGIQSRVITIAHAARNQGILRDQAELAMVNPVGNNSVSQQLWTAMIVFRRKLYIFWDN